VLVIIWIICVIAALAVATGKGHSGCLWFLAAVLLGPLALLAALVVSPAVPTQSAGDEKICPRCAESVKAQALVCRFCGFEFASPAAAAALPPGTAPCQQCGTPTVEEHLKRDGSRLLCDRCFDAAILAG
jgi:hypothetical protein